MSDLHPLVVVAGHKKADDDSPDVLNFMDRNLADFEAASCSRRMPVRSSRQ
jgi:hypothetical protein